MRILKTATLLILLISILSLFVPSPARSNEKNLKPGIRKIVCILPLTGDYGRAGNLALRGVAVANELMDKGDIHEVVVLDSGTENVKTVFDKAMHERNISFIIGPVPYSETEKLGPSIEKLNVPVVVFPLERGNPGGSRNLVRFYYPLEKQTDVLVDFITANKQVSKYGIFYPENKMGREFAKYYEKALRKNGKLLSYKGSYNEDTIDIGTELQWMKSASPDVLFIPDSASRSATVIKKIIANRSISNIFFLGPSTWNSAAFRRDIEGDIDGVLYKTLFTDFIDNNSEEWKMFETVYKRLFKDEPGTFEFRVFKITKLLLLLEKRTHSGGSELVKKLSNGDFQIENYEINPTGNGIDIYPKPMVLTLENGQIRKVK